LKAKLPNEDGTMDIRWNWATFVVDNEGTPIKRFDPSKNPYDKLKPVLEELLKAKESADGIAKL
jgi:glutathione peroxidase-family protein